MRNPVSGQRLYNVVSAYPDPAVQPGQGRFGSGFGYTYTSFGFVFPDYKGTASSGYKTDFNIINSRFI